MLYNKKKKQSKPVCKWFLKSAKYDKIIVEIKFESEKLSSNINM